MTFCHYCGHKLSLGTERFCPQCGTNLQAVITHTKSGTSTNIGNTSGDLIGAGVSGSGNIIGKEISYTVQGNVYNIINSSQEVQQGFMKLNTISTQVDIPRYHDTINDVNKNVEKIQELAATRQVANEFLEEIGRIEKEKGTEIKEIKVGDLQISRSELSLKEIILKGNEHYYKNEYREAIECYDKALKINPNYAGVWNNKGNALAELAKYKEAIECYDKAIKLNPNSAYAWYNKGNALAELAKYREAIECYDKALEIEPTSKLAQDNKSFALNMLNAQEKNKSSPMKRKRKKAGSEEAIQILCLHIEHDRIS
jgi:tetratricopeptide (TPR) repeat protein